MERFYFHKVCVLYVSVKFFCGKAFIASVGETLKFFLFDEDDF